MVDFQLDEMQEMLRDLAREFARDEIRPNAEHWDEESIYPKETIQLAHEMGLLNLHIPEAYGGPGLGCMEEVLVNEELAWGDPGFATAAYATALACAPIITGATEEQKNIWLRKVAEEGALASYAVTEPGAGSDVAAIQTTAVRDGDEYVINGSKMWITGAGYADFFLLQDLVSEDYLSIKYLIPFNSFENSPLPKDVDEYMIYKKNMTDFVNARNQRILNYS